MMPTYQEASGGREFLTKDVLEIKLIEFKDDLLKWMFGIAVAQVALLVILGAKS
jgi:hypothetical protein